MKKTPRRDFLAGAISVPAFTGVAAQRTPDRFFTRRMEEMTSREIEFYLKAGGDLVFVPFGPISGHGAFIPVGMHAQPAEARGRWLFRA